MEFGRELDPIIRWFYISGLSCYPSFDVYRSGRVKRRRFVHYIPTVALIALMISLGSIVYLGTPTEFFYILSTEVLFPIITVLICAISTITLSPYFGKIYSQLNAFEHLSRKKFLLDPKAFRRHFLRRCCIILTTLILPYIVALSNIDNNTTGRVTLAVAMTVKALVFLALMHTLFYIDLLDYLQQCFVRHVGLRAATTELPTNVQIIEIRSRPAHQLKALIFEYKLLHFRLWRLSKNINKLFGWANVATLLHNFCFTILYAHNIIVQTSIHSSPYIFCKHTYPR